MYNLRKRPIIKQECLVENKPKKAKASNTLPLTPPFSEQDSSPAVKDELKSEMQPVADGSEIQEILTDDNSRDIISSSTSRDEDIPKNPNPIIYVMYEDQIPADGYERVRVGNAFVSRNVRKRCMEEGYDLYEYNAPSGYKRYTKLAALYAPKHIIEEVIALDEATKAKRAKLRERSEARTRAKAWSSFDRLFPRMPESERDAVFERAFEKRSGRIGGKSGFSMDEKIDLATRAYIKYKYTDFQDMLNEAKSDLYEESIGDKIFMDRDTRNYAYAEFRENKTYLYEDLHCQVQDEVDQKIQEWK